MQFGGKPLYIVNNAGSQDKAGISATQACIHRKAGRSWHGCTTPKIARGIHMCARNCFSRTAAPSKTKSRYAAFGMFRAHLYVELAKAQKGLRDPWRP